MARVKTPKKQPVVCSRWLMVLFVVIGLLTAALGLQTYDKMLLKTQFCRQGIAVATLAKNQHGWDFQNDPAAEGVVISMINACEEGW